MNYFALLSPISYKTYNKLGAQKVVIKSVTTLPITAIHGNQWIFLNSLSSAFTAAPLTGREGLRALWTWPHLMIAISGSNLYIVLSAFNISSVKLKKEKNDLGKSFQKKKIWKSSRLILEVENNLSCRLSCKRKKVGAVKTMFAINRHLARFMNWSRAQPAPLALIAQRGKNSSCEYFYISLACLQLTSSSCDFRVVMQRYFKCECKVLWCTIMFYSNVFFCIL